ncbi:MAG TPA: hypothetical protein PK788_11715, partial [Gemmatimonadaceae bacterium]|nr:hypothetical protein [Gemmatimonadaceae bacterium]
MDTEEFAAMVAAPLKARVPLDAGFDARVMAAVAAVAAEAATPWWRRKSIALSPLGGLALAAGFGALMVLGGIGLGRSLAAPQVAAATDTVHAVRFVLSAPGARSVAIAGDFNGWSRDATPLEAALDRFVDLSKEFRGKQAMLDTGIRAKCVTLLIDGPEDTDPWG